MTKAQKVAVANSVVGKIIGAGYSLLFMQDNSGTTFNPPLVEMGEVIGSEAQAWVYFRSPSNETVIVHFKGGVPFDCSKGEETLARLAGVKLTPKR